MLALHHPIQFTSTWPAVYKAPRKSDTGKGEEELPSCSVPTEFSILQTITTRKKEGPRGHSHKHHNPTVTSLILTQSTALTTTNSSKALAGTYKHNARGGSTSAFEVSVFVSGNIFVGWRGLSFASIRATGSSPWCSMLTRDGLVGNCRTQVT